MLKIADLKPGDIIIVDDEGVKREGTVVKTNFEEDQALVDNGVQEFWYSPEEMHPVPLDEHQLTRLGFTKEDIDGAVKYKKRLFQAGNTKKGRFLTCGNVVEGRSQAF